MLTIVATPIGNLGDFSFRGVSALKECDYVLCEDCRVSVKLLNHYEISKKLVSYHKFNERSRSKRTIEDLKSGKNVVLVSDAGMPTISDPGYLLIEECYKEGIIVTCVPGASALTTALALSGLDCSKFQFIGFLPKRPGRAKRAISDAEEYPGVTVYYETPHKLLKHLDYFEEDTFLVVIREMTKIHEEVVRGSPSEIKSHFEKGKVRGEIVILVGEKQ